MKVAVIMGSPRKKDSYSICREIEEKMKKHNTNIEFEYIHLNEMKIEDCKGCGICFQKSEEFCPCKADELKVIKEKLLEADGIIMASPVYAYQVTGKMKQFIDRMSYLFHRQELCGKPALIVITTDGGGSRSVYKYLKMTLSGWAMDIIGNIQIVSPMYFKNRNGQGAFGYDEYYHQKAEKQIEKIASVFCKKINSNEKKVPTFYDIFMFNCLRSKTYTSSADRAYWEKKGWLDASYFYEVKMNGIKRLFGSIMKKLIHLAGKKYLKNAK